MIEMGRTRLHCTKRYLLSFARPSKQISSLENRTTVLSYQWRRNTLSCTYQEALRTLQSFYH